MDFGVSIPNNQGVESVRGLAELAGEAEALGFRSGWVSEHLFHTDYVAERLGRRPYHEPLTVLTACAMTTTRMRLGTSVLVLPWHHPVRLAKAVASLDDLCDGRVVLGVGVAITRDEYDALGVPFERRGRIADEMLVAMKCLWTEDLPSHSGAHFRFGGLAFSPKPRQSPHPPILIGGKSPAAMRRVIAHGDGWHPIGLSPDELAEALPRLREALAAAGRGHAGMPVVMRLALDFRDEGWDRPVGERRTARGTIAEVVELLTAYRDAGATEIIVDAGTHDLAGARAMFARFAAEVAPAVEESSR